jgi:hypothetical protein
LGSDYSSSEEEDDQNIEPQLHQEFEKEFDKSIKINKNLNDIIEGEEDENDVISAN